MSSCCVCVCVCVCGVCVCLCVCVCVCACVHVCVCLLWYSGSAWHVKATKQKTNQYTTVSTYTTLAHKCSLYVEFKLNTITNFDIVSSDK